MTRWITVFSASDLAQAEIIRASLLAHGVESIVIDERPGPFPSIAEVSVRVSDIDIIRARYLVDKCRSE
jgi:hypothetical protein